MGFNYIEVETFNKHTTLDREPPPFLIEGVLHRSVTLLYGQTMAGKSTLAASMAVALAGGHGSWLGQPITPDGNGPVVIVTGDPDGRREYKTRLYSVQDELGDGEIRICAPYRPTRPDGWEEVRAVVAAHKAKVVILDNLSAFVPGSLNDDDTVKLFYQEVDKIARGGVAVLVIAHVSEKRTDQGPARLPYGSSFIRFGPRWWGLMWVSGERLRIEFDGNDGAPWNMDLTAPDGTPRFGVLARESADELRERKSGRQRKRKEETDDRRSRIGTWAVQNCQGCTVRQAAEKIAAEFPSESPDGARNNLSRGAYGGVKQVDTRAHRWARP
jgi:hypothetical protein